jgi:hypothetical protein
LRPIFVRLTVNRMPDLYDVTTPLGQRRCDSEQDVRDHIREYMQTADATLNQVSVIEVPDSGDRLSTGRALDPSAFWP